MEDSALGSPQPLCAPVMVGCILMKVQSIVSPQPLCAPEMCMVHASVE